LLLQTEYYLVNRNLLLHNEYDKINE